jgi:HEAT repeat protein
MAPSADALVDGATVGASPSGTVHLPDRRVGREYAGGGAPVDDAKGGGAFVILLAILLGVALADAGEDLVAAASKDLSETARMAAFDRLVALGSTDMAVVSEISLDDEADARQRWVAIRSLGKIRGDRSRALLVQLLEDPMPAIRTAAAGAMSDFGDAGFVEKLNEKLADPAVIVRAAVAGALGRLGDSSSVKPLSDAIDHRRSFFRGRSLWVRRHYVEALGEMGYKQAYPVLLRALNDDDEAMVAAAIQALERIAGFDFSKGRTSDKEKEAWRRWLSAELRR